MASLVFWRSRISAQNGKLCFFSFFAFEAKQLSKLIHQNQFDVSAHVNEEEGREEVLKTQRQRFPNEIDKLLLMLT